jgi:hypothetical protein
MLKGVQNDQKHTAPDLVLNDSTCCITDEILSMIHVQGAAKDHIRLAQEGEPRVIKSA